MSGRAGQWAALGFLVAGLSACGGEVTSSGGTESAAFAQASLRYLALGDSIAFGYNPTLSFSNINNFVGYPEEVSSDSDLNHVNSGCPGETSGSFLNAAAIDNGCNGSPSGFSYKKTFPLHVSYTGSQMAYALSFLATHPKIKLVTINIGANDLLLLEMACFTQTGLDVACVQSKLPGVLQTYGQNLGTILGGIRQAGFKGQIVVENLYAKDYRDQLQAYAISLLNGVAAQVAKATGATMADAFGAFGQAAAAAGGDPCAAGLLIATGPGTCDQHPSVAGRHLLAGAIESVLTLDN